MAIWDGGWGEEILQARWEGKVTICFEVFGPGPWEQPVDSGERKSHQKPLRLSRFKADCLRLLRGTKGGGREEEGRVVRRRHRDLNMRWKGGRRKGGKKEIQRFKSRMRPPGKQT